MTTTKTDSATTPDARANTTDPRANTPEPAKASTSNVRARDITPDRLRNLRAHAESGDDRALAAYVDCGTMVGLLNAVDQRDELQAKLDEASQSLSAARERLRGFGY